MYLGSNINQPHFMADILLTDDGSDVTVDFGFATPQAFFYTIEVTDDQLKQFFHSTGRSGGTTSFAIGNTSALIGKFLVITWTVIDPAGPGNAFKAAAVASQNGQAVPNPQVCSGSTSNNPSSIRTAGQFVANL
jgi:hypothetical protein